MSSGSWLVGFGGGCGCGPVVELAVVSPSLFPERVVADAGRRCPWGKASKGFDRAKTTAAIPDLGEMLQRGAASGAHVDVLTRALRPLSVEQRQRLAERGEVWLWRRRSWGVMSLLGGAW